MDKSNKVLTGCGIGCGAVALIVIVLIVIIYTYIADKVEIVEQMEAEMALMEEEFGDYDEFVPEADAAIERDRLATFIEIRDSLKFTYLELEASIVEVSYGIDEIEADEEKESFWSVMGLVSSGFEIIPDIINYYRDRNRLLLKYDMGIGEYYYIYIISYYSFLDQWPGDGPDFPISDSEGDGDFKFNFDENDSESFEEFSTEVKEQRAESISKKANYLMRIYFQNIMDMNPDGMNSIYNELELLKDDRYRIVWQDGLPETVEKSLEDFRDELERTYFPLANPLELHPVKNYRHRRR